MESCARKSKSTIAAFSTELTWWLDNSSAMGDLGRRFLSVVWIAECIESCDHVKYFFVNASLSLTMESSDKCLNAGFSRELHKRFDGMVGNHVVELTNKPLIRTEHDGGSYFIFGVYRFGTG